MKLDHFVKSEDALTAIEQVFSRLSKAPSLPVAQALARDAVKHIAQKAMADYVRNGLRDILNGYVSDVYGYFDEAWPQEDKDAWEEGLIESYESYFDGLPSGLLSVNFRATIDRRCPRRIEDVYKLCGDFTDEAWRNLTAHHNKDDEDTFGREKTAGQILSSVGVTTPDIEAILLSTGTQVETEKEITMHDQDTLIAEIREGAEMLGVLNDAKTLHFALDNASDDDVGAAQSAFAALGAEYDEGKASTLQMLRMTGGVDYIVQLVTAEPDDDITPEAVAILREKAGDVSEFVDSVSAPAKRGRKPKETPSAPGVTEAGVIPVFVLQTLKDKTGVKAEELGLGVGASRTTFLSYVGGKAKLVASDGNKAYIKKTLDEHIAALTAARNVMEGV